MRDPTANPQAMVIAIKRDPRPHGPHTAVTDPAGAVTAYVYDKSGHLDRTVEPARPAWRNDVATDSLAPTSVAGRNTVGEVTQSRDASGAVTWKRSCQELPGGVTLHPNLPLEAGRPEYESSAPAPTRGDTGTRP
jgi:YD repeat-containing protein